jgi:hypothetical protein
MRENTLKQRAAAAAVLLALAAVLASCVGIDTKVKISKSGSGSVSAEYRMSQELVAFGELEANKALLPVPLARADVENSLRSAKGLALESWSSKKDGTDLVVKTVIAFDSMDALMLYLDPNGKLATYSTTQDGTSVAFSLGDKLPKLDPDMKELAQEAFAVYTFKFAVELPSAPREASSDHPAVSARKDGNTVIFEGKMQDIVASETAPSMRLSW